MIDLERVTYWYPESAAPALDEIDLHIEGGERLIVAGLSGTGKSTLLRVFNGLVPHFYGGRFRGRARIGPWDTRRAGPTHLAEHVGMVFQEPHTRFLASTVDDEVAFGLEVAGAEAGEIRRRVNEVKHRLDIGNFQDRSLDRLSAGEQARVAIGAALARRPACLVLDEPTTELDPVAAVDLVAWLDQLSREHGITIVVAEHRLGRWMGSAERLAYLDSSRRLAACGRPENVISRMPFGDPVREAARRLNLPDTTAAADLARALQMVPRSSTSKAATPGSAGLIARGLSFAYEERPTLADVDVEVAPGEIVALVGRNGSGKTTLLRCLMDLEHAASGDVHLNGSSLRGLPVVERARHIGFVAQAPGSMLFAESVEAELAFTLAGHGLQDHPPVDPAWLLDRFGLTAVRGAYPRDLSAGQRQRAALAAVLVTRPQVVLLDEPTLGMDPLAQRDLGVLLRAWAADGTAVLVASHDVEFIAAYADRVIALQGGTVAAAGPSAETLFGLPGFRTSLQTLTGKPWPACPEDIRRLQR